MDLQSNLYFDNQDSELSVLANDLFIRKGYTVIKNYLNNKDILIEIHESKNSYCTYKEKEYNKYDMIIDIEDSSLSDCFKYMFNLWERTLCNFIIFTIVMCTQ